MKKRHLKRSDFLYIDLERRCRELKEYFAEQDCDYFIVHELLIDYILRSDGDNIFELNDDAKKAYDQILDLKINGIFKNLPKDYEQDALYQFEKYFKIEYPALNVLHDIFSKKNISQNISDKKMYAIASDNQMNLDDIYAVSSPTKSYLASPALDAIETIYGENPLLADKCINMPLITPRRKLDVFVNQFAFVVDPTKPKEETMGYLSKLIDMYQDDSNPIKRLDEFLEIELPRDLKFCQSIKECDIYKYDDKKTLAGRFSDVLYIYDCNNLGYTERYILKEINEYWYSVRGEVNWKKYANRYPEFNQVELEYSWSHEEPEEDKPQYYKNNMHHDTYIAFVKLGKRLFEDGEFVEFLSGVKKV